ncbi:MAG: ATP-binding cassette domain-containing protein, partial [Desulfohalobiaceae bacterium]|nr:ATP-binding cassette domain-containing protein [Desulfohalobiaceae bacterium]
MALLELQNLKVYYKTKHGRARAVDDVCFTVETGGTLGLVGESGCGKTTIAKAIMRLLPKNGEIAGGKLLFKDRDLARLSPDEIRRYRWEEIAMISQSAMNSLNPVVRVGAQLIEAIRAHRKVSRSKAESRLAEVFDLVGIDLERAKDFPHQF